MATKVFLSWGGELSRQLAEAIRDWLPASLQFVKPYFTPNDIDKGTKWNAEISNELETSDIGIICLTRDNINRPWILFEAGALSKSVDKSRVCPLLFNLESTDLTGPLTNFQVTQFVSDDFRKLVGTINSTAGDAKLESKVMDNVFEMWWPRLEKQVAEILSADDQHGEELQRPDRDMIEEILQLTRASLSQERRPSRIRLHGLEEFMHSMIEFAMMSSKGDRELSHIIEYFRRPLKHLCQESGQPDLYRHYMMMLEERLSVGRMSHEARYEKRIQGKE